VKLKIVSLDPSIHDRGAFSCGHEGVDRYLHTTAAQAARYFKSATFVLLAPESPTNILGFYTLSQHGYRDQELDPVTARALKVAHFEQIPMILLGQLGIVKDYQGRGLGKMLLWDAMYRSFVVAGEIGGVALITDPIDDRARDFFACFGFAMLHEQPFRRMLLPMGTLRKAIGASRQRWQPLSPVRNPRTPER